MNFIIIQVGALGEYKDFSEVFNKDEYIIIAFSKHGWESVVKIN